MEERTMKARSHRDTGVAARARLRSAIRRLEGQRGRSCAVDMRPGCPYGAVTRQMVEDVGRDLAEVKSRVNALLFGIAATFVAVIVSAWVR